MLVGMLRIAVLITHNIKKVRGTDNSVLIIGAIIFDINQYLN